MPIEFVKERLPSAHLIRSALLLGTIVPPEGAPLETLRYSYTIIPTGGIYRSGDLIAAEQVLLAAGLVRFEGSMCHPREGLAEVISLPPQDAYEAIVLALLGIQQPLWLLAATGTGKLRFGFHSGRRTRVLEELLAPETREVMLLQLGRTFSGGEERSATGSLVEEYLVSELRTQLSESGRGDLTNRVRRLSLISDQLGYDITAPRMDESSRRIEAKGTRSSGSLLRFYLPRNEAERASVDEDWYLVICRVDSNDFVTVGGWLHGHEVLHYLPVDSCSEARWVSVQIQVPQISLRSGLPDA